MNSLPDFFNAETPIFTVTQFNRFIDQILGQMLVCVTGEISGYKVLKNKWVTFDLKDEESRLGCFMTVFDLTTALEDGMAVKITGRPGLYAPYGKFTFRISSIEPTGEGALQRAFELLKAKLEQEGLFDPQYKKILPRFPRSIGIITSRDAAAYTDILRILNNRWKGLEIFLGHVSVQGSQAPYEISRAIEWFNKNHPTDVLIIARGGGSLEDLQAFNSETVARSIFASKIPIITGIGHERDTTLADFVADVRASTPSNAAELVVPDRQETQAYLSTLHHQLHRSVQQLFTRGTQKIQDILYLFEDFIQQQKSTVQNYEHSLHTQLHLQAHLLTEWSTSFQHQYLLLTKTATQRLENQNQLLIKLVEKLQILNPQNILAKGYSITFTQTGQIIKEAQTVKIGSEITTQLKEGQLKAKVV